MAQQKLLIRCGDSRYVYVTWLRGWLDESLGTMEGLGKRKQKGAEWEGGWIMGSGRVGVKMDGYSDQWEGGRKEFCVSIRWCTVHAWGVNNSNTKPSPWTLSFSLASSHITSQPTSPLRFWLEKSKLNNLVIRCFSQFFVKSLNCWGIITIWVGRVYLLVIWS